MIIQIGTTTKEDNIEVLQKSKNRFKIWFHALLLGIYSKEMKSAHKGDLYRAAIHRS
jgi:hypothetical protein